MSRCAPQFNYAAIISNSRDGEVIAVLTNSYKQARSIRVPHHSRSAALQTFIRELKKGHEIFVVTPDGPRGPLYEVKPGVVLAAQEAEAHLVPLTWMSNTCWHLRTWDRFMIPKPFSTIEVKIGKPFTLPKDDSGTKAGAQLLQKALLELEQ